MKPKVLKTEKDHREALKRAGRIKEKAGKVRFDGSLDELRNLELKKAGRLYAKRSR